MTKDSKDGNEKKVTGKNNTNAVPPDASNASADSVVQEIPGPEPENVAIRILRQSKGLRAFALILVSIFTLVVCTAFAYWIWFLVIPDIWNWGLQTLSWRTVFAVIFLSNLVWIPFLPFVIGIMMLGAILGLYADDKDKALAGKIDGIDHQQQLIEDELEKIDKTGLIPLIRYSRLQLREYYQIGLSQTQRSFRNSEFAMWIGFVVIIGGLVLFILPIHQFQQSDSQPSIHVLTIAAGSVIEVISALFLWVYRSSINQLTYFYNRQMYVHSVLLCDRIAEKMKNRDETSKLIVEKVLDRAWQIERPSPSVFRPLQKKPAGNAV